MDLYLLKQDADKLKHLKKHPCSFDKLKAMIQQDTEALLRTVTKSDVMPFLQEQNRLNSILGGLKEYHAPVNEHDESALINGVILIYKDVYLTNKRWVKYLTFNLNKVSSHLGLNGKQPKIMNIARNIMIQRFGMGNTHEILDVHSDISILHNTPLVMIAIKYI